MNEKVIKSVYARCRNRKQFVRQLNKMRIHYELDETYEGQKLVRINNVVYPFGKY